ncbi:MAG TPA: polyprenyl diphosphate synthase [Clostridia bacterium]|nr:polyprenyl diphosphate synthase [Clostridia bacterium]
MENDNIPKHIAIIMDGNGRWARMRSLPRTAGHIEGAKRVKEIVKACAQLGCEYLTVYALSTENLKRRPPQEIEALMKQFIKYTDSEKNELRANGIKTRIIGDRSVLSDEIKSAMRELEDFTAQGGKMTFNIAINYGSQDEVLMAVRKCAEDVQKGLPLDKIDKSLFEQYLYTANMRNPDLIIRTAGEYRISNFLLYQAAYSELYFTGTYWPDFDKKCLMEAVEEFKRRNRRYGGL